MLNDIKEKLNDVKIKIKINWITPMSDGYSNKSKGETDADESDGRAELKKLSVPQVGTTAYGAANSPDGVNSNRRQVNVYRKRRRLTTCSTLAVRLCEAFDVDTVVDAGFTQHDEQSQASDREQAHDAVHLLRRKLVAAVLDHNREVERRSIRRLRWLRL